ncbi:MAG TPA: hypothetical protein VFA70_09410 [Dehalococcoidia bacterium]|jgi:hypothetical protein|nr:hypothetical protein [Dehalococcoidia bacterium]
MAVTVAAGTLLVAFGFAAARGGAAWALWPFWAGVVTIFLPASLRLCAPRAATSERVAILSAVAIGLYLIKVLHDPTLFTGYDEFQHWRTADDILRSGRLFEANTLLPISALYPGLEIVTSALSTLTGLSIFWSGTATIGAAHLLLVLSIYLLGTHITRSPRFGALAALLYLTNSAAVFFDSLFAYESLALPLAAFVLYVIVRSRASGRGNGLLLNGSFVLTAAALVVTHHLTTYMLLGFLTLWTAIVYVRRFWGAHDPNPLGMTLALAAFAVAWLLFIAWLTINYLTKDTISGSLEILRIILREEGGRLPFQSYGGQYTAPWERLASFAALGLTLLILLIGAPLIWLRHRRRALALALAAAALSYPVLLSFRLTRSGTDISARAPEFLFVAIALVAAIAVLPRWFSRGPVRAWALCAAACATTMLVGGIITGWGPSSTIMPGGWVVEGDSRSIDAEGLSAAAWAYVALGPGNRFGADRTGRLLFGTYGEQRIVTNFADHVELSPVYTDPAINDFERALLVAGKVAFLEVDLRMSEGLPLYGVYFEPGEEGGLRHTSPLSRASLLKFQQMSNVSRLYDNGDIAIYDVRELSGE